MIIIWIIMCSHIHLPVKIVSNFSQKLYLSYYLLYHDSHQMLNITDTFDNIMWSISWYQIIFTKWDMSKQRTFDYMIYHIHSIHHWYVHVQMMIITHIHHIYKYMCIDNIYIYRTHNMLCSFPTTIPSQCFVSYRQFMIIE